MVQHRFDLDDSYYLVASTQQIGNYWGKQLGLSKFIVISKPESVRGRRLNRNRVIVVEGENFDYPDINRELIQSIEPSIIMSKPDEVIPKGHWIRVDDNNREEIYVALIARGYKLNTLLHNKVWGFYICPERGISQLSSGGSVVTEKTEIIFKDGIFKLANVQKDVVSIFCSSGKLKFFGKDIRMISIKDIESVSIQSSTVLDINGKLKVKVNNAKTDLELINMLIESELKKSENSVNFLKIK